MHAVLFASLLGCFPLHRQFCVHPLLLCDIQCKRFHPFSFSRVQTEIRYHHESV
jgi:hypothetical protein